MKACIFDLDGTLTNTLESLAYSVKATLREMDLPEITKEQCRKFVGDGAKVLMERALKAAGEKDLSRLEEGLAVYGRIFDANCTYHVAPYEGIPSLLEDLRKAGVKLAVLSNKPHEQAIKVVREMFGDSSFDYVSGQQEGIRKKPDPAGVEHILDTLQMKPEDCLYVGDSEVDVQTGKNAGVETVIVTWGFRTREELRAAGAGNMIDRPEELLQYI